MNIEEQPTQPLAFPVPHKQPINYRWLKTLSDASGVHLMQVHRFVQGKRIPPEETARIRLTLLKLSELREKRR